MSLFARRGFGGATTSELAKAAGVTEPIIYRHFQSKKELFMAVIARAGERTIETWERQLRNSRNPAQRLTRLIGANPMVRDRGRGIYRVIVQAMMEIEDPDVMAALQRHVASIHEFLTREIRAAQDKGYVSKAFTPEITAWTLLHLGLGYGVLAPLDLESQSERSAGPSVRDLVARLMLGPRATEDTGEDEGNGTRDGDED